PHAPESERIAYTERMGLDQPLAVQYLWFLGSAARGDFGRSLRTGQPATQLVFERLPRTLALASVAILFVVIVSVPIGVAAAVDRGGIWDRFGMGFALLGQA